MVFQALEMIADGMDWDSIIEEWEGKVPREAIAEAVSLANKVFIDHVHEYKLEPLSA